MDLVEEHIARVRIALLKGHSLSHVADWILENTYLKGDPYSFLGHEFQEVIARDQSVELVVRKCAQIGLSELSARIALAQGAVMPGFTTIYTLPTAHFAGTFAKTRIDPIIGSSPELTRTVNYEVNSSEVKQFGDSFLYIKGTKGTTAAISVPADCLIHDELDFSDLGVVSQYESRLTHSSHRRKKKFSTPTIPGWGISHEFETARRHYNFVKCNHCTHQFLPNYEEHVVIPGYDREKRKITPDNLYTVRWREAYLACPSCGKEPDLGPEHRQWVVENNDFDGEKNGYQIQPFDAPTVITPAYLVKQSTTYKRYADFTNFMLGLPAEDSETSFSIEELEALFEPRAYTSFQPYANVIGIDVGITCHILVSGAGPDGLLDVLHAERCDHTELEKRKGDLCKEFRVRTGVMDSQPYFDLLLRMQRRDRNLWGAVYSQKKGLEIFADAEPNKGQKEEKEDQKEGRAATRQLDVNRNRAFDTLMEFIRGGGLHYRPATKELQGVLVSHMRDMKRVREYDVDEELKFAWKKSARGNDHFHHALLYSWLASRLLGAAHKSVGIPLGVASFSMQAPEGRGGKPVGELPL